jgi:Domain of unknown function (DUF4279)
MVVLMDGKHSTRRRRNDVSIDQAKATLRLHSDTATAAQVTHRLGLVPSFSAERGEPITPRHPTRLRDRSLWRLDSRLDDHQPLHHHLADLLDQLAGKHQVLTELAVSYDIDWFCLAATDNTQGSVELPHELIARLAAIPGDLVLDIYTGEDQP